MGRTDTDGNGNDLMKQIPGERVYRVTAVEAFEDQARTLRRRVGSLTSDRRERLPVGVGNGGQRKKPQSDSEQAQARTVPVDDADATGEESPDRTA